MCGIVEDFDCENGFGFGCDGCFDVLWIKIEIVRVDIDKNGCRVDKKDVVG